MKALIVAGSPEPSSAELVSRLAAEADYVIAADSGADILRAAGRVPDLFCGDQDSAAAESVSWVEAAGLPEERFPWKKDDTDLGLAFSFAEEKAARLGETIDVTVTCASGGRCDHALAVFGVLAEHAQKLAASGGRVVLEEDAFVCTILAPGQTLYLGPEDAGHTFSALSLAERTSITEQDMLWSVDRSILGILDDRGVSNRIVGRHARCICHEGMVAAFVLRDGSIGAHA